MPRLDPAEDPRVEWAIFGREVQQFLRSNVGDFLIKKSESEIATALAALKVVSPWRRRRIQQLQNEIAIAERFQLWLADAIAVGQQAESDIQEEQHG